MIKLLTYSFFEKVDAGALVIDTRICCIPQSAGNLMKNTEFWVSSRLTESAFKWISSFLISPVGDSDVSWPHTGTYDLHFGVLNNFKA